MSRISLQGPYSGKGALPLANRQKRLLDPSFVRDGMIESWPVAPCVVYDCTVDLIVQNISPNSYEIIGIQPENILGKRLLSEDRILPEECARLRDRVALLKSPNTISAVHAIADDRGVPVWVAHSLRKVQNGFDSTIVGCMTPIANDFIATKLDPSIISQFVHKMGNHFQLINLLIGSLKRVGTNVDEIEALQQTVDRAVEFTRSFSHFSQTPVCAAAVDIGDILSRAAKSVASACLEKNVTFQGVEESQGLNGALVSGDAFLLEFAFGAVLQNALEATNSGDQISVGAKIEMESTTGRGIVQIVVADNGVGIEADMLAKVTDPFVSSKHDRDGLGLSTAVRIVEIHGGRLRITSTPGQGTRVEIELPITRGSEQVWK